MNNQLSLFGVVPGQDAFPNCVTAHRRDNSQNYVLEEAINLLHQKYPNRGILIYKGIPCFIRCLTERELFRLMDCDERDIDTLLNAGIARTQLSKLAGNSIVVSCLYYIFKNIFVTPNPQGGRQTKLF